MALKEYRLAKDNALLAFKNQERKEFLMLLAQAAHALGEYHEAIDYYQRHIVHAGASVRALNALGECYLATGNIAETVKAWEKSLQIDGKQPRLKERLDGLKGEKK